MFVAEETHLGPVFILKILKNSFSYSYFLDSVLFFKLSCILCFCFLYPRDNFVFETSDASS